MRQQLVACFSLLLFAVPSQHGFILKSPVVTHFGSWDTPWDNCQPGKFVKSVGLKYSHEQDEPMPPPGSDDPDTVDNEGLTEIGFECVDSTLSTGSVQKIQTPPGATAFKSYESCDGLAIGFQLMSDDPQIALDNTGANNFRLYCSDLRDNPTQYIEGFGEYIGEWTEPQFCKTRQAICGIQSQTQTSAEDATGINNIRVKCCDIPSPADSCTPTERWEVVQTCDNLKGKNPIECTFYRTVGLGMTMTFEDDPSGRPLSDVYYFNEGLGFSLNSGFEAVPFWLIHDMSKNFARTLGDSNTTAYDWTLPASEVWNVESTTVIKFEVKEGYKAEISQLVGACSYFSVRTPRYKKEDLEW